MQNSEYRVVSANWVLGHNIIVYASEYLFLNASLIEQGSIICIRDLLVLIDLLCYASRFRVKFRQSVSETWHFIPNIPMICRSYGIVEDQNEKRISRFVGRSLHAQNTWHLPKNYGISLNLTFDYQGWIFTYFWGCTCNPNFNSFTTSAPVEVGAVLTKAL